MKRWTKYGVIGLMSVVIVFALHLVSKYVLPIIFGLMFGIMLSASAERIITQTVLSSDGTYEAYVLSVDAGAVGGDTFVYVKKLKDIGIFQHKEKMLQSGEWGQIYEIVWQDDNTLLLDGKVYEMEDVW